MTFDEVLAQIIDLLKRQGRVSYGALKRRYDLDDAYLEDLKDELIKAQRLAIDEEGSVLVWVEEQATASPPPPAPSTPVSLSPPPTEPERDPLTYWGFANSIRWFFETSIPQCRLLIEASFLRQ